MAGAADVAVHMVGVEELRRACRDLGAHVARAARPIAAWWARADDAERLEVLHGHGQDVVDALDALCDAFPLEGGRPGGHLEESGDAS